MPRSHALSAGLVCCLVLPLACTDAPAVSASGDHEGLTLRIELSRKGDSLFVATAVRNTRAQAVHLDADQCGRVTEVVLARTVFEPEGEAHAGSIQAVKQIVLQRQRSAQDPERFAPRRVTGGSGVPDCIRPERPVTLDAGKSIEERWELPLQSAYGLAAVGSERTLVRAEVVEAAAPESLDFLDILPTGAAEDIRKGRNAVVEEPTSAVLVRPATTGVTAPSVGQRFDRMIEDGAVRAFIAAQPADSWRQAELIRTGQSFDFKAVTTGYERAITATVSDDGRLVTDLRLPGANDRTRIFERRPATLPPGITRIPAANEYVLTDDLIADRIKLPSGHVVADGGLTGEAKPLPYAASPGSYPVHVTLARYPDGRFENVVLASLVVSEAPTVVWKEASAVSVDGGTAAFTSAEGSEALGRLIHADDRAWFAFQGAAFDSLSAHDHLITEFPIDGGLNLVMFSTGNGDGGYPVFVGLDADGKPTSLVIDFLLVHLDWPHS